MRIILLLTGVWQSSDGCLVRKAERHCPNANNYLKMVKHFIISIVALSLSACGGGGHVVVKEFSDCPLCKAAKDGDLERVEFLLDSGVNPDSVSFKINAYSDIPGIAGDSALRFAVFAGHAGIVKMLLANGANPNIENKNGSTPLTASSGKGISEIVQILLDNGANPNQDVNNGGTPLIFAAQDGYAEVVKILLDGGANPNQTNQVDNKGWTALMFAVYYGHAEAVKVLLDGEANPNQSNNKGWTALNIAAEKGQPEVAKVLLDCGASPDKRNNEGVNAWHWANRQPVMNAIFRRHLAEIKAGKIIKSCPHKKIAAAKPPQTENAAEYVFENTWRSVVVVRNGDSQGSGVIIQPNVVATNCHVVKNGGGIVVYKHDNRRASTDTRFNAVIRHADKKRDYCLLDVGGLWGIPANIRQYNTLKVGENVYALGSPEGLDLSLSAGVISQLRQSGGEKFIQTDAAISPGSSGGGLFDSGGNLIGILTSKYVKEDVEGIGFAIPADLFLEF